MQEWLMVPGELDLKMVREWALWLTEVEYRLGARFARPKRGGVAGRISGDCAVQWSGKRMANGWSQWRCDTVWGAASVGTGPVGCGCRAGRFASLYLPKVGRGAVPERGRKAPAGVTRYIITVSN